MCELFSSDTLLGEMSGMRSFAFFGSSGVGFPETVTVVKFRINTCYYGCFGSSRISMVNTQIIITVCRNSITGSVKTMLTLI